MFYTVLVTDRGLFHSTSQAQLHNTGYALTVTVAIRFIPHSLQYTNVDSLLMSRQLLLSACSICHYIHFLSTLLCTSMSIVISVWLSPHSECGHHCVSFMKCLSPCITKWEIYVNRETYSIKALCCTYV
jgi:hypothetical protein